MVGTDTAQRILDAGRQLFAKQGYSGTGMKAIAVAAKAPFGSIYHFYPGGKDALAAAVIRAAGQTYGELVPAFFDGSDDVVAATRASFVGAAQALHQSGYADACPIAAIAQEVASTNETLRQATADAFAHWLDLLAERYARAGLDQDESHHLAIAFVASLQGGFLLARALQTPTPVIAAGEAMSVSLQTAISKAKKGAR